MRGWQRGRVTSLAPLGAALHQFGDGWVFDQVLRAARGVGDRGRRRVEAEVVIERGHNFLHVHRAAVAYSA